jgi:hypothetical protein
MHIVPIASGKGGVGKSLVAANIAIALAQQGKRVVLVDLDLGGSNLHLILGIRGSSPSLGSFLGDKKQKFESIIQETDIRNLRFIPGDAEIPGLANINSSQKKSLIRRLSRLDNTDYVILDLGAGTSQNILDFYLMSGQGDHRYDPNPDGNGQRVSFSQERSVSNPPNVDGEEVGGGAILERYLSQSFRPSTGIPPGDRIAARRAGPRVGETIPRCF